MSTRGTIRSDAVPALYPQIVKSKLPVKRLKGKRLRVKRVGSVKKR